MNTQDIHAQLHQEAQKELRYAVLNFFHSDSATSVRVRDILNEELREIENLNDPLWAKSIYVAGIAASFAKEYSESFTNEYLLNYFVKLHGDQAYEVLKRERPSLPNHSFVKGILYHVQSVSLAIQIKQSISEALTEIGAALTEPLRKKILDEDPENPFASKAFEKLLKKVLKGVEIR